jgi:hypothetical protein
MRVCICPIRHNTRVISVNNVVNLVLGEQVIDELRGEVIWYIYIKKQTPKDYKGLQSS